MLIDRNSLVWARTQLRIALADLDAVMEIPGAGAQIDELVNHAADAAKEVSDYLERHRPGPVTV